MLRPERMSKVSVTGTKAVMSDFVAAVHDANVLHLSEYEGQYEGFEGGDPVGGAEDASEKLVTVRSLESILGVTEDDAGPTRIVTDEALEADLAAVREEVNALDDRRSAVEDELRAVEERIDALDPFVDLGIDLDLLGGYDSLDVVVGEADPDAVEDAIATTSGIGASEVFSGDGVVAAFARPSETAEDPLEDALVGVDFTRLEVPDGEGAPADLVAELEHERETLASRLESVESELEDLRLEHAGFLLAAEERLSIEVQKREAPMQFATTERAFVAEGWVPTDEYTEFVSTVRDAVGDRVEIEELERASFTDSPGHGHGHEGDGEAEAATDGGHAVADNPPVVQDTPRLARPFELLVQTINRPLYTEYDPTVVLWLTFPAFFGFMIGDLGYGSLYVALGYWLYSTRDSPGLRSLGGIGVWAGGFTMLFGVLYGEIFGLHVLGEVVWSGHPPIKKGLQLHYREYAQLWLVISLLAGLLHLTLGWVFGFVRAFHLHDAREALTEYGSWIILMLGVWGWVFSTTATNAKPTFLFDVFNGSPFPLGFAGFSPTVGWAALGAGLLVGFPLLIVGEGGVGALESLNVVSHVLSYTRIAAVLLAKAGMALVVNLLVFGAELTDGEFHFIWIQGGVHHAEDVVFSGLFNMGVAGLLFGLVVLVVGHLLVLALGVTSAGLQAVRLEYVEFFGKFYEGGGEKYDPFGYRRRYTTED